ncbi:RodZ domain-containing protein [Testudinibacter sp. P80/BLE/0925]|uniref:RodZ domain-containing protein n=1 Tax=Testudinibacter sp. TW-1 TaxID=3417757 RepID=UPI003D360DF4
MENQQQQTTFNLGETLRQAREKLGLSVEQTAQKTLLKTAIIKHIENNEFIVPSCPPTFMKGYVRNYAKFLKVPESVWNDPSITYGEAVQNDLQKNMRNNYKVNHYSSYSGWIGRLTWIVALAMIGMTAYWWWQNYQQSQDERTSLVENFLSGSQTTSAAAESAVSTSENQLVAAPISENQPAVAIQTDNPLAGLPAADSIQDSTNVVVLTPPLEMSEETADNASSLTPAEVQTSGQVLSNVMEQLDGSTATANTENETPIAVGQALPAAGSGLTIEIVGSSCWLSVRDGNRKVLAQKEYKQGEVLNFADGEPYSLVIGAPQNVRITFQGQEVPLTIDGRVARIKLPN